MNSNSSQSARNDDGPGQPLVSPTASIVASRRGDAERRETKNRGSAAPSHDLDHLNENDALAAAIELQSELDQADRLDDAIDVLARRLREILGARRILVFWRTSAQHPLRLTGDTDQPSVVGTRLSEGNPDRKLAMAMAVAASEETAILDRTVAWRITANDLANDPADNQAHIRDRGGMLAIAQMAKSVNARVMIAGVMGEEDRPCRGTVLVVDPSSGAVMRFWDAMHPLITSRLVAIERMQPGRVETVWRLIAESFSMNGHGRTVMIVMAAFAGWLLMPATYTVSVPFELQPVARRYVAVPFDGPLKACHVRPGDVVTEGEVLAEIDPREIQYELAGVRSQWEQAEQARKSRIAEHDFAAGQLAELESQRLKSQTDLLTRRQDNLEIRSPVDGIIVTGDWRSSEGMPLARGETLFEVAPLDEMVVELWIDESEIALIRRSMTVKIATHAEPDHDRLGTISHIHPKAEIQGDANVFIAEVRLDNADGRLQPGMRGYAKIYGDRHAIGWNWFHRPWYALRDLVRW